MATIPSAPPLASTTCLMRSCSSRSIAPADVQTKHCVTWSSTLAPALCTASTMAWPWTPSRSPMAITFFPRKSSVTIFYSLSFTCICIRRRFGSRHLQATTAKKLVRGPEPATTAKKTCSVRSPVLACIPSLTHLAGGRIHFQAPIQGDRTAGGGAFAAHLRIEANRISATVDALHFRKDDRLVHAAAADQRHGLG